ncbi:MAG TPA: hypothetical protein VKB68_11525 [Stellaceae bacterium]|nr:hypothetical protein [Stellaceae bacterium]
MRTLILAASLLLASSVATPGHAQMMQHGTFHNDGRFFRHDHDFFRHRFFRDRFFFSFGFPGAFYPPVYAPAYYYPPPYYYCGSYYYYYPCPYPPY